MIKKLIPHINIVTTAMMLVLFVLNRINDTMAFLKGDEFETLLFIMIVFSLVTSLMLIAKNRQINLK
mgnify:CR=1 FL=1